MPNMFNKLPGFDAAPPGIERQILRRIPRALLWGSLLLGLPSLVVRILARTSPQAVDTLLIGWVDIHVISLLVLYLTILFTVAIGAFIVMIMKGPAYTADAYPLQETEKPTPPTPDEAGSKRENP